jgi:hypothetical protein
MVEKAEEILDGRNELTEKQKKVSWFTGKMLPVSIVAQQLMEGTRKEANNAPNYTKDGQVIGAMVVGIKG